jgi:high-affinity iron transporter
MLPLFILLAYLYALDEVHTYDKKWRVRAIVGSLISVSLFYFGFEIIAESFEGRGYEFTSSIMLVLFFLSFGSATIMNAPSMNSIRNGLILLGVVTLTTLKATEFLVYFGAFVRSSGNVINVILGLLMGLLICISFHLLYRFFLRELVAHSKQQIVYLLWFSFLTGQVIQIPERLSQINLIDMGQPLFNLSHFVPDNSEYGHVLNALFGYESSPSLVFITVYLLGLINLVFAAFISSRLVATKASELMPEVVK